MARGAATIHCNLISHSPPTRRPDVGSAVPATARGAATGGRGARHIEPPLGITAHCSAGRWHTDRVLSTPGRHSTRENAVETRNWEDLQPRGPSGLPLSRKANTARFALPTTTGYVSR